MQQILTRANGSQVRITASIMFGRGLTPSVDLYVHHRETKGHPWKLANDRPHPDWRTMSVDDYIKRGRAEIFRLCSHGELFRAGALARLEAGISA